MSQENVVKQVGPATVTFQNVDSQLVEKVNQMLDLKISRGVPLSKIREEMDKFGWPSEVEGEQVEPVTSTQGVKSIRKSDEEAHTQKKSKKGSGGAGDKSNRACETFARMEADGKTVKEMISAVMKELDITYANAYYYYNRVFKKK